MFFDTFTHEEGNLLKVLGLWGTTQNVVGWRVTKGFLFVAELVTEGEGITNSSPLVRLHYLGEQRYVNISKERNSPYNCR